MVCTSMKVTALRDVTVHPREVVEALAVASTANEYDAFAVSPAKVPESSPAELRVVLPGSVDPADRA
jgi:hypothetical protein